MKNKFIKSLIVGFLVIMAGLVVIASDIVVKQGDLTINKLTANNIAIGTSNPGAQLHINRNAAGWASIIENTNTVASDANSGLLIKVGEDMFDTALFVQNKAGNAILKINGIGNVGIGNTDPGANLDVTGTFKVRSLAGTSNANTGKVACIKNGGVLGYCSTAINPTTLKCICS
ncbi:hypothetical protein HYV88_06075 [Candidatus Woesearchaeota archaeon]|nr:hypothetical protein [Candidatus Woesearchaeota archaeon]